MFRHVTLTMALSLAGGAATAAAGEADVVGVEATVEGGGSYRFDVTVEHGDEGWDHYADAWDVVGPDSSVLGTRVLAHPHENEQPFTRSLGGVAIPDGVTEVTLRAKDSVHEYGGVEMTVTLPVE
ncbi:MAG: hypothetical protein ACR2QH_11055 [Geminicoccaceae bacterium]